MRPGPSAPRGASPWTDSDTDLASYDLAYSTDGGGTYPNVIATGVAADQTSYAWTVPGPASTTAKVRVTAHDIHGNTASDASDANFSITSATHTIAASAGEQ